MTSAALGVAGLQAAVAFAAEELDLQAVAPIPVVAVVVLALLNESAGRLTSPADRAAPNLPSQGANGRLDR